MVCIRSGKSARVRSVCSGRRRSLALTDQGEAGFAKRSGSGQPATAPQ